MPIRILLIYRYPLMFQAFKALREGEGFRVMGHQDNHEAVQFAQQFQPDIVIVDLEMPGPNGCDCVRQILEASPATRIIMLSKHTEEFPIPAAPAPAVRPSIPHPPTPAPPLRSL